MNPIASFSIITPSLNLLKIKYIDICLMYMLKNLKKILNIQPNEFPQLSTVVYYLSKNRNRKLPTLQKPVFSKSKTTSKLHSTPNYPLYVLITVD